MARYTAHVITGDHAEQMTIYAERITPSEDVLLFHQGTRLVGSVPLSRLRMLFVDED